MKKSLIILFVLICYFTDNGMAQPKQPAKKTNGTTIIIISIKSIEYDNPSFADLRKTIKGNIKVSESNPGFTGDAATITLQYDGNAPELWDELPQLIRQQFKITAISNNRIDLQLKQNTIAAATTTDTKKDDCVDCYYYKACGFDTSFDYNGNTYSGFKNKAAAYYCKNGILYSKSYSKDNRYKQIIFKAYEPSGTSWIDTFGTILINKTIVAKGSGISYKKKFYDDVMIVYFAQPDYTALYYYAKGSGFIKADTLDKAFNPLLASQLRGMVDTSLAGTWKYYNDINKTNYYYQFYGDGTFAYYSGSISKQTQMPSGVSLWRANDNYIEVYNGAWSKVSKIAYKKRNDPVTGKPAIAFGTGNNIVYYVSEDGKPSWK